MELHEREEIIIRAKILMDKYGYDPLLAIRIVENELTKEKEEVEMGEIQNDM